MAGKVDWGRSRFQGQQIKRVIVMFQKKYNCKYKNAWDDVLSEIKEEIKRMRKKKKRVKE